MRQLRLLSKNKRQTQRIVVEFESQGGQPTRIVHESTRGKEGQHKQNRPRGDRSRMTPRCGDIVVPTLRPQTWGHCRPHLHPIWRPRYCCCLKKNYLRGRCVGGGDGDDESMMAMAATGVEQWCYRGEINNEWWIDILCPTPVLRILFFLPAFCPRLPPNK